MDKPSPRTLLYYYYSDVSVYMLTKYGFNMDDRKTKNNSFWLMLCDIPGMRNGSYMVLERYMLDNKSDYIRKIVEKLFEEFSVNGKVNLYVGW